MPFGQEPEPRNRKRTGLIAGGAAGLVVLVAGGAFAATQFFGGPSGDQPAAAVPDNASVYTRIDLDPGGKQQLNAYNYLKQFPAIADKLADKDGDDLRKTLFETMKKNKAFDEGNNAEYAEDVEPWLGDRAGIAAVPSSEGQPDEDVFVVQVTDENAASEGLKKLGADGVAFTGDYAVITDNQKKAESYVESAEESPLSENEQFSSDVGSLEDEGFASFWVDMERANVSGPPAGGGAGQMATDVAKGRVVGAFRFEENYAELAGQVRGTDADVKSEPKPSQIGTLPDSTVAALSVGGGGPLIDANWDEALKSLNSNDQGAEFDTMLRQIENEYGVTLPDDLVTVFGDDLSVVLDESGIDALAQEEFSGVGIRMTTDVQQAEQIVDDLISRTEARLGVPPGKLPIGKATGDGTLAVGGTQELADTLSSKGKLGEQEAFTTAVPDKDAQLVMYADLAKIQPLFELTNDRELIENAEPLQSVGLSGGVDKDGNGQFSLRLVTK